jgi:hypothetical protein
MNKINVVDINDERYVHASTTTAGSKLYGMWKVRGKVPEKDYRYIQGGIYIKESTANKIEENGLPRKSRASLDKRLDYILNTKKGKDEKVKSIKRLIKNI